MLCTNDVLQSVLLRKNTFEADSHPWDLNSSFALNDPGKFPIAQKIMGVVSGFHAAHEFQVLIKENACVRKCMLSLFWPWDHIFQNHRYLNRPPKI